MFCYFINVFKLISGGIQDFIIGVGWGYLANKWWLFQYISDLIVEAITNICSPSFIYFTKL